MVVGLESSQVESIEIHELVSRTVVLGRERATQNNGKHESQGLKKAVTAQPGNVISFEEPTRTVHSPSWDFFCDFYLFATVLSCCATGSVGG